MTRPRIAYHPTVPTQRPHGPVPDVVRDTDGRLHEVARPAPDVRDRMPGVVLRAAVVMSA